MDDPLLYYMGFSHFLGIGPMRLQNLLANLSGAEEAYRAPKKKIEEVLGVNLATKFMEFRHQFNAREKLEEYQKKGITVVCWESKDYPVPLKKISDPPICLYVKGNLDLFDFEKDFLFAIVGTRKPTSYGQQITRLFASQLIGAGAKIISGMAMGVDTVAHQTTLSEHGKTIAVLGCGVDIIYPAINKKLYEDIVRGGGVVMSEFPPGMTVMPGLFIARNRIISGLSKGVLVVEGAKDSGALITARYAGEQGRDVFAPPGPITSEMSEAPNILLKQGAKLVTRVEDILEEYNMQRATYNVKRVTQELTPEEKEIYDRLIKEPMFSDELSVELKKPVSEVLNLLSLLEIKGIVEKNGEGKYMIILN